MASEPIPADPVKPQPPADPAQQPRPPAWWSPSRVPGALLIAVTAGLIVFFLLQLIQLIWG